MTTYDVHLELIGKRIVDFLLMLIELCLLGVTAESLRVKRDRKSAISLQRSQFYAKFLVEGIDPRQSFCTHSCRPMNAFQRSVTHDSLRYINILTYLLTYLQLCPDSFHTKKLCSRLSSSEVRFYTESGRFTFLSPPLGAWGNVR